MEHMRRNIEHKAETVLEEYETWNGI
jgi:hypothetical protein